MEITEIKDYKYQDSYNYKAEWDNFTTLNEQEHKNLREIMQYIINKKKGNTTNLIKDVLNINSKILTESSPMPRVYAPRKKYNAKKYFVYCRETDKLYPTIKQCAKALKISHHFVEQAIKGDGIIHDFWNDKEMFHIEKQLIERAE